MPLPTLALRAIHRASQAKPASKRFFEADGLSLEHFLARRRAIALYREIIRSLKGLNKTDAHEIRQWARSDFERYRGEKDLEKIKSLITSGKHQMHSVQQSLMLAQAK
ncbi:hypothetical protein K450DRAFT_248211 [Umbelopsis ramanniana AG]|uniref:Complex 1 LYR protein domain-containing protein n=1 Tax=Umbelopsis ramanniana AG TaxID=1314678 RepID=A0AAD5E7S5_UMBRA|nr:uncharacterized protein K450DRAFT_248211 [Umbelopsis ramanniana AG]KAI8578307.1 hypothetical protein K450DRAFT_248211 [Umbelopsis ramanniana AG]